MATVYDKSSLFLAPSGVDNGTVFVQKPVPIYGSEQVTNGDFSQEGAEEITNGDFATDSDWTKQGNVAIANGVATFDDSGSNLNSYVQQNVLTATKKYIITLEVKRYVAGRIQIEVGGNIYSVNISQGVGSYSIYTSAVDSAIFRIKRNGGYPNFDFDIDNVSVKEVGQDWTLTVPEITIGASEVNFNSVANASSIRQYDALTVGKIYKATYTISNYSLGGARIRIGGVQGANKQANGTYTEYITATLDTSVRVYAVSTTSLSITNISVQEVLSPAGDFTFTRDSNLSATRVNEAQLIEKGRENLLLQSNQFDTTWVASGTSVTSGHSGYDGSNDAWLLKRTDANARYAGQNIALASSVYTYSVYAKPESQNWLYFWSSGSPDAYFDLQNGAIGTTTALIDATIVDAGNGYYKCSITYADSISSVRIYPAVANEAIVGGLNDAGIYIQDAQLEQGLAATSVITTGAGTVQAGLLENTPRLDYSGGATCPSLLLEPSRANLMNSSEYFRAPYWSEGGIDSVQSNVSTTADPTGGYGASKIIPNTTVTLAHAIIGNDLSTSTQYTVSIFAKAAEYDYLWIRGLGLGGNGGARFNISTGVVEGVADFASATIEDYGNGWYRCIATGTTPPATTTGPYYHPSPTASYTLYAGDGTSGIYTYGAQVEAASYATSYIPTYGTSQTRAQDVCGDAGDAATFNSTEGVLYAEVAALDPSGTYRLISLSSGSDLNRVFIGLDTTTGYLYYYVIVGGNVQANGGSLIYPSEFTKVAVKYKENDFAFWINGVKVSSDSSGTTFPANTLNVLKFNSGSPTVPFYGKTKELIVFPTALSDLQLAILTGATTYETFDEMALALNYTVYE